MTEQQSVTKSVSLFIDYGNGAQKSIKAVPCMLQMGVTDVLDAAGSIGPGLEYQFVGSKSDRAGREVGSIVSIDNVDAGEQDGKWVFRINDKDKGTELRRVVPGSVSSSGFPGVDPGDVIELKRVTES